jgi:hypothetical protein
MLFLIVGTFLGLIVLKHAPEGERQYYDPKVNDGWLSLIVHVPLEKRLLATTVLQDRGAVDIHEPEERIP